MTTHNLTDLQRRLDTILSEYDSALGYVHEMKFWPIETSIYYMDNFRALALDFAEWAGEMEAFVGLINIEPQPNWPFMPYRIANTDGYYTDEWAMRGLASRFAPNSDYEPVKIMGVWYWMPLPKEPESHE